MNDRFLEDFNVEDAYVGAYVVTDKLIDKARKYFAASEIKSLEPDSKLPPNGQMYDEKGRRFDVEGNQLTGDYGQPFPN